MKKKEVSKSSLFLLELMISIVFFALAAAGCVQIFAKAHLFSEQAEQLDMAVSIAQSVADTCHEAGKELRYYDASGAECDPDSAVYQVQIETVEKDGMMHLKIDVMRKGQEESEDTMYHLETDVYDAKQTGGSDE